MDPKHKKTLRMNRVALAQSIDAIDVLEKLVDRMIYSSRKMEDILSKGSKQRITNFLLNDIETRGPKAYKAFAESLVETGYGHLADNLIPGISRNVISDRTEEAYPGGVPMEQESSAVPIKQEHVGNGYAGNLNGTARYVQADHRNISNQISGDHLQLGVNPDVTGMPVSQPSTVIPNIDPDRVYKMCTSPRGLAIIINNDKFKTMKQRLGTEYDVRNLQYVFSRLGFDVQKNENLTASGIKALFQALSAFDHSKFDCLVVCILTHGTNGGLFGTDEGIIGIEELTNCFHANKCPTLAGKPKLFFLQACRGESVDNGIESTDGASVIDQSNVHAARQEFTPQQFNFQSSLTPMSDSAFSSQPEMGEDLVDAMRDKLPSQSDMLLAYATVPGFVSWRNSKCGSWFIQALCEVLLQHASTEDLLSMMTMVNQKVAYAYESSNGRHKQMPAPVTMLRKKVFFFPGR
ncbi:caspase-3-like isoform X2 [Antedon mediterranea]